MTRAERNRRWRLKYPDRHKANYDQWLEKNREKRSAYMQSYNQQYFASDEARAKRAAYMKQWRAKARRETPEKLYAAERNCRLKRIYGLSHEVYEAMLAAQGGHCALCPKTPEQERYKLLNVDHCHDTGKVRGLLCTRCNSAIGQLGDNAAGLLKALSYLKGTM